MLDQCRDFSANKKICDSTSKTLGSILQEKYRDIIQCNIAENLNNYVYELKKHKSEQKDVLRTERKNIQIIILKEIKTNKEFYKSKILVGNGRNPFFRYPNIEYDLDYSCDENCEDDQISIDQIEEINTENIIFNKNLTKLNLSCPSIAYPTCDLYKIILLRPVMSPFKLENKDNNSVVEDQLTEMLTQMQITSPKSAKLNTIDSL